MREPIKELPHYRIKKWLLCSASVDKSKVCLLLLHIKFSLTKIFVQAVDKESKGFGCLRQKFPQISEAKMKEGIFVGLQIYQLFKDRDFSINLNLQKEEPERRLKVCRNFLGMKKWKITVKLCSS
jgi:hypothetical protein